MKISLHKYQIYTRKSWNKVPLKNIQENDKSNETDLNTNDKDI